MSNRERRLVTISLAREIAQSFGVDDRFVSVDGLPEDAELVGLQYNLLADSFDCVFYHHSFEIIDRMCYPPRVIPHIHIGTDENGERQGRVFPPLSAIKVMLDAANYAVVQDLNHFVVLQSKWFRNEEVAA